MFKEITALALTMAALAVAGSGVALGAGPHYGDAAVHAKVPTPPGHATDGRGRVYVLDTQLAVVRLDVDGTHQSYSKPFPDLPRCLPAPPGTPCSPTPLDMPPLPNDIAFDDAGNAYVSDSMQATVWRVPPGGGAPQIWFQDARLASEYIGVNGLRINPPPRPTCTSR